MSDYSYLRPLRADDYLVFSFGAGADATGPEAVVPFRVVRQSGVFDLVYDPVRQLAISGPMVGPGVTPVSGQSASFLDNILFGLNSSVTNINGVTDIFMPQMNYEVLQVWYGIAPSYIRAWLKQPYNAFVTAMDQNIIPASTYPDVGYVDGFDSPYGHPASETEFFTLQGLSANFALYNPTPLVINPRFNFAVNRMMVRPVRDPEKIRRLVLHDMPAHYVSIANPTGQATFPGQNYGAIRTINRADVTAKDYVAILAKLGYC